MPGKRFCQPQCAIMKTALCDASSLIILYKAGLVRAFVVRYRVVVPASVFEELVIKGKTGAERFRAYCAEGSITVEDGLSFADVQIPLRGGEAECVRLYRAGRGDFILTDDGKAADYCRASGIPFINALLVPKLLLHAGILTEVTCADAMQRVRRFGRYARWVVDYAERAGLDELCAFMTE